MLNDVLKKFPNHYSLQEMENIYKHHDLIESNEINWENIKKSWREDDGTLCIEYANGQWFHYNEVGEWW